MFALRWSTGGGIHEAVCADGKSAWEIYWAIEKSVERSTPTSEDYWIEIFSNGVRCNPEGGSALPPYREGQDSVFILKKAEQYSDTLPKAL